MRELPGRFEGEYVPLLRKGSSAVINISACITPPKAPGSS